MNDRTGPPWILYPAAFIFFSLSAYFGTIGINKKLDNLEKSNSLEVITQDVIGGREPEKFYNIGTNRGYLEIDGRPVESYFSR